MKVVVFLLFMLLTITCFALGTLKVESVKALPDTDLQLEKYDADAKLAPLLIVKTDLTVIQFQNVSRPTKHEPVYDKMHGYWKCYMNTSQRSVEIGAPGYETIQVNLLNDYQIDVKEKRCYELVLLNFPEHEKIPFAIISEPADAEKWVDGVNLGTSQSQQIALGTHELELRKIGYKTFKTTLNADKSNPLAQYKLEPVEQVKVTIKSNPTEAQIFINNLSEGSTNKQLFKYPGIYNLRLVKDGYETIEDSLSVLETGENSFPYDLVKASVTLTLNLTPSDAIVKVDNQQYTGTSLELASGSHKLEVSKPGYDTVNRQIVLEKGKDISLPITLNQQRGKLIFTVEPMEATVTLDNGQKWDGSNQLMLPVGSYTATATLTGYVQKEVSIDIENGKETNIDVKLEKGTVKQDVQPKATEQYRAQTTYTASDTSSKSVWFQGSLGYDTLGSFNGDAGFSTDIKDGYTPSFEVLTTVMPGQLIGCGLGYQVERSLGDVKAAKFGFIPFYLLYQYNLFNNFGIKSEVLLNVGYNVLSGNDRFKFSSKLLGGIYWGSGIGVGPVNGCVLQIKYQNFNGAFKYNSIDLNGLPMGSQTDKFIYSNISLILGYRL